jgi:hypothetical protein
MDQIPHDEVRFHPHSFGDPDGRLFWWDGGLYRAIKQERAPFFKELFRNGLIQDLVHRGLLVGSEPTCLTLDGYGMVIRHREVPFPSYPHEWCPAMFKHAAITYVDLATELARRGLGLKDTHPWNILFDSCKPVYVDLTSIGTLPGDWTFPPYDKFCRYYLYPLLLMAHGKDRIARCLMPEYEGVSESDVQMLSPSSHFSAIVRPPLAHAKAFLRRRLPHLVTRLLRQGSRPIRSLVHKPARRPHDRLEYLEYLRRKLEAIPVASPRAKHLDGERVPPLGSSGSAESAKQRSLQRILDEVRPGSVLDIGSDIAWCPQLPAVLGSNVVAFSSDSAYVTALYDEARARQLSILPLIMDFTNATPSRGLSSHSSIAATERFRCDLVLALSLLPDMVLERRLRFDQLVDGLALFAKRCVVLEFPRFDDPALRLRSDTPSWYTLDNLMGALKQRFRQVAVIPSNSEPWVLLFCEK